MTKSIALKDIRIDGGTQPRAEISVNTVREYSELLSANVILPPPDVFFDGVVYWLADGFHRFFAAKQIERLYLTCEIHDGTKRDAVLFSVGANSGHGLQRTHADKRKAVTTLLADAEWTAWSNKEIARRCGVNSSLVDDMRKASLPFNGSEKQAPRTYTTKHGTEATMKVEKIGRPNAGAAAARRAAYEAKQASAAEGVSAHAILRRRPSKSDAELVTRSMHAMEGIINALEHVDIAALANDPQVDLWRDTSTRMVALLRAFNRSLERKSA